MIVAPYTNTPVPPTVALLTRDGEILSEHGELLDPDDWPKHTVCLTDYDTVRALVNDGKGEALCWNHEEIRWRHERLEDDWRRRQSDVAVIRLPFPDDEKAALRGLAAWRDWLAGCGASPVGTTGSAAWSLLRASIDGLLYCSGGSPPPLLQTMGGRIELGPAGPGRFEGRLAQWDLQAAYATEIGNLRYGGRWFTSDELPVSRSPDWWAQDGRPVFVRAVVRVPDLAYGPLIRRPRKRMSQLGLFFSQLTDDRYPTSTRMQGIWTWQEIEAALEAGCQLLEIRETWVHLSAVKPFAVWWQRVQDGRQLPGFPGLLAKTTGNALWGRFCMDPAMGGVRTVRGRTDGKRVRTRKLPARGGMRPAHDLAETVSGRVRARLFLRMLEAGDSLISAHTDGLWTRENQQFSHLEGRETAWRLKQPARRLDLIDPQTLRYWPDPPRPTEPWVVMAGVPAGLADQAFESLWQRQ